MNDNALNPDNPQSASIFRIAAILFLATLIISPVFNKWSGHFATQDWHLSDEGIVLHAAYRTALGQVPHIAFTYYYAGGTEIILGELFRVFRSSFDVGRWLLNVSTAANIVFVFVLFARFSISTPVSVIFALVSVLIGRLLNYHVSPAWFAITLVPLAMLFLLQRPGRNTGVALVLAGIALGVATSMKQTTGLFSLAGFVYYLFWSHPVTSHQPDSEVVQKYRVPVGLQLFLMLLIPVFLSLVFFYVIRRSIAPLNLFMFMTLPVVLSTVCIWSLWRKGVQNPQVLGSTLRALQKRILLLVAGFIAGIVPILLYYFFNQGLRPFISESFLTIQSTLSTKEVFWPFGSSGPAESIIVILRRFGIYLIPMASVIFGLVWGIKLERKSPGSVPSHALVLSASTLAALWFTLYPLVGIVYLYYLFS